MSKVYYERVPDEAVEAGLRAIARDALTRARYKLGLPEIRIQWVREISEASFKMADDLAEIDLKYQQLLCLVRGLRDTSLKRSTAFADDGGFFGKVHPYGLKLAGGWRENEILLNAAVPPRHLPLVVGHECKHLADFRDKRISSRSVRTTEGRAAAEGSADQFGEIISRETQI